MYSRSEETRAYSCPERRRRQVRLTLLSLLWRSHAISCAYGICRCRASECASPCLAVRSHTHPSGRFGKCGAHLSQHLGCIVRAQPVHTRNSARIAEQRGAPFEYEYEANWRGLAAKQSSPNDWWAARVSAFTRGAGARAHVARSRATRAEAKVAQHGHGLARFELPLRRRALAIQQTEDILQPGAKSCNAPLLRRACCVLW